MIIFLVSFGLIGGMAGALMPELFRGGGGMEGL